jgi:hypothetical protein
MKKEINKIKKIVQDMKVKEHFRKNNQTQILEMKIPQN